MTLSPHVIIWAWNLTTTGYVTFAEGGLASIKKKPVFSLLALVAV